MFVLLATHEQFLDAPLNEDGQEQLALSWTPDGHCLAGS